MKRLMYIALPALLFCACTDEDGDGYAEGEDCNDRDPYTYPGAPELCDGRDNDCDGEEDEGTPGQRTLAEDLDGDGYGGGTWVVTCEPLEGYTERMGDCRDDDPSIHPDALEVCNELDDDCNGVADDGCEDPREDPLNEDQEEIL